MNNENKTNINWYPGHMAKTRRDYYTIVVVGVGGTGVFGVGTFGVFTSL